MPLPQFIRRRLALGLALLAIAGFLSSSVLSQPPGGPGGGPNAPDRAIVKDYDADNDGFLNQAERGRARADLESNASSQRRRGPRRGNPREPGRPGPKVSTTDVESHPNAGLYDQTVLRTLFLEFPNEDWEKELATFKPTDVEVPAQLTVDGKVYPNVGVSFRGASSFFMIPEGLKRSINLSIDFMDKDQRLYGYKSLNLLNCNGDASMMSSILYSHFAGLKIPVPKVNYVKVVINGESWGLYVSSQQFNKTFVKEHFDTTKGARWKVSGSPRGDGGLRYLGEETEPYKERFDIKSKDKKSSWKSLINLCRVLNETPQDQLEAALAPILDVDGALWFLAVDVALVNSDGYWTRASDYSIYMNPDGKFHILPHDMNEALRAGGRGGPPGGGPPGGGPPGDGPPGARSDFRGGNPPAGGRGDRAGRGPRGGGPPQNGGRGFRGFRGPRRGGGPGHGGTDLDPLVGLQEERMPLRSVLLSNPKWRNQYLHNLKEIAELLKWEKLGPRVQQYTALIEDEVALDTRKLFTTEAFQAATSSTGNNSDAGLKAFAEKRSEFLLNHESIKALGGR